MDSEDLRSGIRIFITYRSGNKGKQAYNGYAFSNLQAYSLQKILERHGRENRLLPYTDRNSRGKSDMIGETNLL